MGCGSAATQPRRPGTATEAADRRASGRTADEAAPVQQKYGATAAQTTRVPTRVTDRRGGLADSYPLEQTISEATRAGAVQASGQRPAAVRGARRSGRNNGGDRLCHAH